MKMTESYTIAYENVSAADNIFLCLETDTGLTGYGCAAPDRAVTHETVEGTLNISRNIVIPLLHQRDPLKMTAIMENLRQELKDRPAARAMVDMALYDLLGKIANLPLYQLLGGYRKSILTSMTIGILPMEETLALAKQHVNDGFMALKIKGGRDVELDIDRVRALRKTLGGKIQLRFDANQGYNANEALHFVKRVKDVELELLEQPTPRDNLQLLGAITHQASIPIMADESLMGLKDVFRLAKKDLVDMVNIKLMKTGGIANAVQINAVARAAGIDGMIGCMDESALSIAAGLHFALSSPNIIYADLDGHLGLKQDPANGAVILKKGRLYPTDRPGLGFNPDIF
ncbi:MAG: dipeptide epimerase [Desulfobacteraceae bacterium]